MNAATGIVGRRHDTLESNDLNYNLRLSYKPFQGPWCELEIEKAAQRARIQLDADVLAAKVDCLRASVIELFILVVEVDPDLLPPRWAAVHEALVADERMWVRPRATLGDHEDGIEIDSLPRINHRQVAALWSELLENALTAREH